MRIAVVTKYFPTPEHPWAGHSAYQTLRILARTHAVHVFYPRATYPAFLTPAAVRVPAHVDRAWKPADVPVDYIPYPALPVVTRQLNGFSIVRSVLPHVRAFRPDLILNYVVYPDGFAAVRIARALNLPSVLTAIGSDLNRIADPACGALIRYALRHATLVTTVSQALARVAQSLGADPARTIAIHNGCDTAIFHPRDRAEARTALSLDPAQNIIVYIGRLDRDKGLVELIDAMAQLRPERPNLHCYLIGDGPDEALLRQSIAAHSLGDASPSSPPAPPTRSPSGSPPPTSSPCPATARAAPTSSSKASPPAAPSSPPT